MAETHEKDMQFAKEEREKEEEEYVLLELDDCLYSDIQPNAPYVLSGRMQIKTGSRKRSQGIGMPATVEVIGAGGLIGQGVKGLDTLTPMLILGDGLKMIGEYQETVGTCYLFSETDAPPKPIHKEMTPSGENKGKQSSSSKEVPSKEVKHLASVQKILKFRAVNVDHQQHRSHRGRDREI